MWPSTLSRSSSASGVYKGARLMRANWGFVSLAVGAISATTSRLIVSELIILLGTILHIKRTKHRHVA